LENRAHKLKHCCDASDFNPRFVTIAGVEEAEKREKINVVYGYMDL
jgi:hypothetical protein